MRLPDKVADSPPPPALSLSSYDVYTLAPPPSSSLPSPSSSSPPPPPRSVSSPTSSPPSPPLPASPTKASPPNCPIPDPYYSSPESISPPPLPPTSSPPPAPLSSPPPPFPSPPSPTLYPSPSYYPPVASPPPLPPPPPLSISPPPPATLPPPSAFFYASPPPPWALSPAITSPSPPPPVPTSSPPPPTLSSPPDSRPPPPKSPPPPSPAPPPPPETLLSPFRSPPPPIPPPPPFQKPHSGHSSKAHHSPPSLPSAVRPSSRNPSVSTNDSQKSLGVTTSTVTTIAVVSGLVMLTFLGAAAWFVKKRKKSFEPAGNGGGVVMTSLAGSSQSHVTDTTYPRSPSYPLVRHASGSYVRHTSGSYGFPYSPSEAGLGVTKLWFTLEDLSAITNGFSSQNLLGEGGFGSVYKGCLPDGRLVAVKQLKVGGKQGEREFQAEVETISRAHHRHLVSLVGYCISENQRLLAYDYVPNNTLYYHLHEKRSPVMSWTTRVKVAAGAARGIAYLHEDCHPKIIHRDIKSSNILLDNKFEAQVSDFGLATSALDSNTHVTTRVMGTFGYLAPEYASSGKLTAKSDVYSFGVVLLELITGRKPVDASRPLGDESLVEWARPLLIHALETGDLQDLPDQRLEENYVEDDMFRMIETAAACVRHSAAMRPRMGQVVRVLDGLAESNDITNGIRPGQSEIFQSLPQSEEIRMFQRREFGSLDYSNEHSRSSWKSRTDL